MKVLIVDDSRAMRMIIRRTLRQAGFSGLEIREAASGRDALVQTGVEPVDLILADWSMPEMDGLTLLIELRRTHQTPFCFLTPQGTQQMRDKARAAGANLLISKPFTPDSFAEDLGRFLA